jgi:hypothetical protein
VRAIFLVFLLAVLPIAALAESPKPGDQASPRPGDEASPKPGDEASPRPGADLVGRWLLDPDRSDSIKPMMELMGAPWAVRQMVGRLRPAMTLTLMPTGVRVLSQTRVRETEREIVADGERRESLDAAKRTVTEWSEWQEDGTLKVWRNVPLKDGPVVEIVATWRRNGADMEIESIATAKGEDTVRTHRVFSAVAP